MKIRTVMTLVLSLALVLSCAKETSNSLPDAGDPATATSTGALPPGHPPVSPGDGAMTRSSGGPTIVWDFPQAWSQGPPSSSMRLAQATIPGTGGNGEVVVYFFGVGGGGGVEPNLQRWEEQVTGAAAAKRESFESGAYRISLVEKSGTLQPSMMGSGPQTAQPNSRLLAAVVEGEGGPWFFKATGPEATIAAAREDFLAMLRTIRPVTGTPV